MSRPDRSLGALARRYAAGDTPVEVFEEVCDDVAASDDAIWIHRVDRGEVLARAARIAHDPAARDLPLFGVPVAIKDNIDLAGTPTTAGCPAFSSVPDVSASAVRRLEEAGAIIVGKTNLDQFATGLAGTRSPYGVPRNPLAPGFVPGGSSSGSGVAVASGLVSLALGTDTAGSGRVPAAMTGIVGVKPTRGLVSGVGVVPACRSLDCVSVFSTNVDDGRVALEVLAAPDPCDPWCRSAADREFTPVRTVTGLRLGVPGASALATLDDAAREAFDRHVAELDALGLELVPVDLEPFLAAGVLLYEGPWVAERLAGIGEFVAADPDALDPIVAEVLAGGHAFDAVQTFAAIDRLRGLRGRAEAVFEQVDLLVVPSVPIAPTLEEVASDPHGVTATLGTFTNFVNLLDLAAVAVPGGIRPDGAPVGFTLIGDRLTDLRLLAVAEVATGGTASVAASSAPRGTWIEVAVVGAHLRGQPLHHQLIDGGATFVERTTTAAAYRLYALADTTPPKPGLVRASVGASIEVEVYALPAAAFGRFVDLVPAPLAIGSVELASGRWVSGFVCEPRAIDGATDVTVHGGWRAFLAAARPDVSV